MNTEGPATARRGGDADGRAITIEFDAGPQGGRVSGLLLLPEDPRALLVLAHGAGAGMRHPALAEPAALLLDRGIGTLRYRFPYREAGLKIPDRAPILEATVLAAIARARDLAPRTPLLAGGKSLGGRMTSQLAAREPLAGVIGIVLLGFPLHPAGKPGTERAAHLAQVSLPMLFVQGTRDDLADLRLLEPICRDLGARAQLHRVEGGDHSFGVLRSSGRTPRDVCEEIAEAIDVFASGILGEPKRTPQSGAVPFRRTSDRDVEFCLVTSMKGQWGFPKGMIDPGETAEATACKEAREEAGVEGEVQGTPLGSFEYEKWGLTLRATFYLLEVTRTLDEWPERAIRKRRWCGFDEARRRLARDELRELLERARERLQTHGN